MQCPGGHLEYGESFAECAKREVLEETGLKVGNIKFLVATNDIFGEGKHYVTIFVTCTIVGEEKEPKVRISPSRLSHDANLCWSRWSLRSVLDGTGFRGLRCGLGQENRLRLKLLARKSKSRCFCLL